MKFSDFLLEDEETPKEINQTIDGKKEGYWVDEEIWGTYWTGYYKNGKKVGDWVVKTEHLNYVETFDNNGNRITFKSYKPENPTQVFMEVRTSKDGGYIHRVYYDDGHLKEIYRSTLIDKHGPYKKFHENGMVADEGQYKKGKEVGVWYKYDKEGTLIQTTEY